MEGKNKKGDEKVEKEDDIEVVYDPQDSEEVKSQKNVLFSFLKQLKPSSNTDFTKVSTPAIFAYPYSLLEICGQDQMQFMNLLADSLNIEDPLLRSCHLVRFFLGVIPTFTAQAKKPFNPVLGEVLHCKVKNDKDEVIAEWTGEQVSHHPPVSMCSFKGTKEKPFSAQIQFALSVHFQGTYLKVEPKGDHWIKLESVGDEWRWQFPCLMVYPIRWAAEWAGKIELVNEKQGIVIALEFCSKPIFWGKWNEIKGSISKNKEKKYEIRGHWDDEMKITDVATKSEVLTWNRKHLVPQKLEIDESEDLSSPRVWKDIRELLLKKQHSKATEKKKALEEQQRKRRAAPDFKYTPRYFSNVDGKWIVKPETVQIV